MDNSSKNFEFGKNWSEYIEKYFSSEKIELSKSHLLDFLKLDSLEGLTFLDIGCGSGLHSLAAFKAGASKIVSFDYDPDSVHTAKKLRAWVGSPSNWEILQGSVLDKEFMAQILPVDVVYSWGVLHHTGDMWTAIRNSRIPLNKNGVMYIALYSFTGYLSGSISGYPTPQEWLEIKQKYNNSNFLGKKMMELEQVWRASECWRADSIKDFFSKTMTHYKKIRSYPTRRGMNYWTDMKDWLGGWPMDFVEELQCMDFCKEQLGLDILRIKTGEGNTEFLFRPEKSNNYWDNILKSREMHTFSDLFVHQHKNMWSGRISGDVDMFDDRDNPKRSSLILCEDGLPLAYAHSPLDATAAIGLGRYKHCEGTIYFATSDNSDPNVNGRIYSYYYD